MECLCDIKKTCNVFMKDKQLVNQQIPKVNQSAKTIIHLNKNNFFYRSFSLKFLQILETFIRHYFKATLWVYYSLTLCCYRDNDILAIQSKPPNVNKNIGNYRDALYRVLFVCSRSVACVQKRKSLENFSLQFWPTSVCSEIEIRNLTLAITIFVR